MENFDYSVKKDEWINAKEVFNPVPDKPAEPAIDKAVSEIVGKPIRANDPRLIKLVVKWKKEKGNDKTDDNFLQDEAKIKELKETLI